jgi:hypothetical protein
MSDDNFSPIDFNRGILKALGIEGRPVAAVEIRMSGGSCPVAVVTFLMFNTSAAAVVTEFVKQEFELLPTNRPVESFRINGDGTRSEGL